MTRNEARKNAALLLAYADGATIQACSDGERWYDAYEPDFAWGATEYRVSPKPRECWRAACSHGAGFVTSYAYSTREACERDCGGVAHPVRFVEAQDD